MPATMRRGLTAHTPYMFPAPRPSPSLSHSRRHLFRNARTSPSIRGAFGLILGVLMIVSWGASGALGAARSDTGLVAGVEHGWAWPLAGARRVVNPYVAPAHAYAAGHRGVDIGESAGTGPSAPEVRAPAAGVVAFVGTVVDRPLLTIDHGNGLVTTFEPVASELPRGSVVEEGTVLGTLAQGGHAEPGQLHIGARLNGEYINPLTLFGGVPRAVLLPCCEPLT